jgi:hypothetical protein
MWKERSTIAYIGLFFVLSLGSAGWVIGATYSLCYTSSERWVTKGPFSSEGEWVLAGFDDYMLGTCPDPDPMNIYPNATAGRW